MNLKKLFATESTEFTEKSVGIASLTELEPAVISQI
jgi:hypothetical protein